MAEAQIRRKVAGESSAGRSRSRYVVSAPAAKCPKKPFLATPTSPLQAIAAQSHSDPVPGERDGQEQLADGSVAGEFRVESDGVIEAAFPQQRGLNPLPPPGGVRHPRPAHPEFVATEHGIDFENQ